MQPTPPPPVTEVLPGGKRVDLSQSTGEDAGSRTRARPSRRTALVALVAAALGVSIGRSGAQFDSAEALISCRDLRTEPSKPTAAADEARLTAVNQRRTAAWEEAMRYCGVTFQEARYTAPTIDDVSMFDRSSPLYGKPELLLPQSFEYALERTPLWVEGVVADNEPIDVDAHRVEFRIIEVVRGPSVLRRNVAEAVAGRVPESAAFIKVVQPWQLRPGPTFSLRDARITQSIENPLIASTLEPGVRYVLGLLPGPGPDEWTPAPHFGVNVVQSALLASEIRIDPNATTPPKPAGLLTGIAESVDHAREAAELGSDVKPQITNPYGARIDQFTIAEFKAKICETAVPSVTNSCER